MTWSEGRFIGGRRCSAISGPSLRRSSGQAKAPLLVALQDEDSGLHLVRKTACVTLFPYPEVRAERASKGRM
jgi:hypothetical protein